MSEKEVKIDFSGERLLALADDAFTEGNKVDALKLLNQHDELYGATAVSLGLRANAYDDLRLYEEAIFYHNKFFAYIDRRGEYPGMDLVTDAYSDLVALYKEIGEDTCAKYYYAKMIMYNEGISTAAEAAKIANDELSVPEQPIFSELKDEMDRIERVEELLYDKKVDQALEELQEMKPTDKSYLQQMVMLGQCYLLKKDYDKAISTVKQVIIRNASDFEAGCILVQAYLQSNNLEEARKEITRLISKNPDTDSRIQRVAYNACDAGMHKEAYNLFKRLHGDIANQEFTLFFHALSAYNCEKYAQSLEILDRLCTIHPNSENGKYFLKLFRANIANKGVEPLEILPYLFKMPDEMEQPYKDSIAAYLAGENHKATKSIRECFNYAVEMYGTIDYNPNFFDIIDILDKNRQDDLLEELLLDLDLFIAYESEIFCRLILRDEDIDIAMSRNKLYSYQSIKRLDIGKSCRKTFVTIYSNLVGRFNLIYQEGITAYKAAVEQLYNRLQELGKLNECRKSKLMFCAACYYAAKGEKLLAIVLPVMEDQYKVTHDEVLKLLDIAPEEDPLNVEFTETEKVFKKALEHIMDEAAPTSDSKED